jgi:hypothetical protein
MRTIRFRGMGIVDSTWHYGMLGIKEVSVPCCEAGYYIISRANMLTAIKVHPKSVGQFTGLMDRHGEKIYEGDIVTWASDEPEENPYSSRVYFEGGAFYPVCELPPANFTVVGDSYGNEDWRI